MKESKFAIGDLLPIGITFVILGISVAYGLKVMGDVRDTVATDACTANTEGYTTYNAASSTALCYNSSGGSQAITSGAFNASSDGIDAVAKLPANLPTVVTVIIAAIVVGILLTYMVVRNR